MLTWSGALLRRREICAITLIPNSIIISSYPKTIETFSSSGNNPTASQFGVSLGLASLTTIITFSASPILSRFAQSTYVLRVVVRYFSFLFKF